VCGDGNPRIIPAKKREPDMSDGDNSVKTESSKKIAKANYLSCVIYYFWLFSLLFFFGCNQQQGQDKAGDLFVDAVMLKELEKNEVAVERLNSAIKLDKSRSFQAPAYSLLGEIYMEMGRYEESAAAYAKATQLDRSSFNDFFSLGKVYEAMKQFPSAAHAYARACGIDRNHLEAHISAAKCYYKIKDYDRALSYGRGAERIDPDVSEVQNMLGEIYVLKKDYEQAIHSYKRSLEIDGHNPDVMVSLAVAYLSMNQNEAAKEVLEAVVQIQPDNNTAYKHLGYCYLRLKDIDKSIGSYNKAIEIDENDWDARRGLGVAYILKGTNEDGSIDEQLRAEAVRQWQRSLEIKPDQPNREGLLKYIRVFAK